MDLDLDYIKSFLIKELIVTWTWPFYQQQKQQFELLTFKKYARLNEERKEIIEKIERGAKS
jgi:hypothetical protein